VLDVDNQKDWSISIFPEDFVDLDVVGLEGIPSGIPADEPLLLAHLNHKKITLLIISNMASWNRWSKNQMLDWLGSYSKGMA
jgi:hypothetical protein